MITDVLVAFDHQRHEVTLIADAFVEDGGIGEAHERAVEAIGEVRERLREPVPAAESSAQSTEVTFASNMSRQQFESTVSRIIEYIHAGDAFQVVPSQRFSAPTPVEAFSIYRGLRTVNPSPYMYFLDFGDFEIAGASPEPLVKVTGRRVETRPIAGTYPRGASEEEDRRQAERLLQDPKGARRARDARRPGPQRPRPGLRVRLGHVDELMVVETYSHVLHIVSQVSGTLRDDVSAMDVLRSVLPAGTLSGAPKVRAMQIIDELEPHKRGSYGGAIGYLSWNGDLDTAIHIRTVVVKDGLVHVQAGGGTVAGRAAAYEYNESVNKAKAVFRAVELAGRSAGVAVSAQRTVRARDRQLRLLHLQPRPVPGRAGAEVGVVRNDKATVEDLRRARPDRLVVSPGPCTPKEAGISVEAIRAFAEGGTPVLGVCLGHQSLVEAFGGQVVRGDPIHGKDAEVKHDGKTIYAGLPNPLVAGRYHSLSPTPTCPRSSSSPRATATW